MLGRAQAQKSFGDEALELHVSDHHFLMKVSRLIDWAAFDGYWPTLYGTTGKPSSDPLVCFKMLLLEQWYNLSDTECEAQCANRLSFRRFLGLSLSDTIPDETVLVRFRKRLLKARLAEPLFAAVLAQIEAAGVIVRRGTLVDATIVRSAKKALPKGGTGGDAGAGWAVRNGRAVAHGFKAHIAVDDPAPSRHDHLQQTEGSPVSGRVGMSPSGEAKSMRIMAKMPIRNRRYSKAAEQGA